MVCQAKRSSNPTALSCDSKPATLNDSFGNKLTATTSGQGITPRTSATTYSADGRFPVTVTNALGHSESRTYDPIHGVMLTLTGPNGLTTSWSYDSSGRKTREDRADDTWTTITRGICAEDGTGCPVNAPTGTVLFTTTEASGSPPASGYADKLGRVTRKERVGFDGSAVFTDTEYNSLGQIARVSRPYFTDDTIYWTRYEYDTLGRVVLEASPTESDPGALNGNNNVMRIHLGLAVTEINVNNHETTRFKNLQGKLSEVIDEEPATSMMPSAIYCTTVTASGCSPR
ncbi:hypothetical protein [Candidatus Vondammii sp. HM_W22]|uniref:hypothetical protein n=1 Tax=Candidatus Vondammii sp. HM_W22 TaxID=2687299 RepID=UPI001F13EC5F|nr:hypothetical protein [Candidatus Vondammii sp. HM_W22]